MYYEIVQKLIAIFVPLRTACNSCPLELRVAGCGVRGVAIQTVGAAITIAALHSVFVSSRKTWGDLFGEADNITTQNVPILVLGFS